MMRETIERSGWYPNLCQGEREIPIAHDVDRHWHLMINTARNRLLQGIRQSRRGGQNGRG